MYCLLFLLGGTVPGPRFTLESKNPKKRLLLYLVDVKELDFDLGSTSMSW